MNFYLEVNLSVTKMKSNFRMVLGGMSASEEERK